MADYDDKVLTGAGLDTVKGELDVRYKRDLWTACGPGTTSVDNYYPICSIVCENISDHPYLLLNIHKGHIEDTGGGILKITPRTSEESGADPTRAEATWYLASNTDSSAAAWFTERVYLLYKVDGNYTTFEVWYSASRSVDIVYCTPICEEDTLRTSGHTQSAWTFYGDTNNRATGQDSLPEGYTVIQPTLATILNPISATTGDFSEDVTVNGVSFNDLVARVSALEGN